MTNSVAQDAIPVTADVLLSPMSRGGAAVTWYSENTPASKLGFLALLLESSHLVTTRNVRGQACNDFQPPSTSRALAPRSGVNVAKPARPGRQVARRARDDRETACDIVPTALA